MKRLLTDPTVKFFVSVLGLFAIFIFLRELQHIFIPLVIAYFMFFFFEPLNTFLEKHRIPIGIVIFIDIVLTASLLYGVSRVIIDSLIQFGEQVPLYEQKLNRIVSETAKSFEIRDYSLTHFNIARVLRKIDYSVLASGVFESTLSVVTSVLLVLFFFIFISSGHEKTLQAIRARFVEKEIKNSLKKMKREHKNISLEDEQVTFDEENFETITHQREATLQRTSRDITEQVQKYIITKFLISLSVGLVMGFILWAFDVEFFIIWAALAVILNFIPNIGSVISVIMPALMTLVQYESFGYAFLVTAVLVVVQNIIGNIIEPKIFGNRLGLNPLVILLSLLLWGYLWGIVGMFISVPLTAIIKIIISNSTSRNMRFITHLMSN
ncbi:MAG: AI-2E family transporter [Ignavibacteria bacterium]|nr:AI-2E family transporter [Ignavibacteria bacterium]MDP3581164.1 AI-2E family transporter [Ignavibacteria bacterium]